MEIFFYSIIRLSVKTFLNALLGLLITVNAIQVQAEEAKEAKNIIWLNHFELLPGSPEITTSYNSTTSGVGDGSAGLVIQSSTQGDTFSDGGSKVLHMGLQLPKRTKVKGVIVCYEYSNGFTSFINSVLLKQLAVNGSFRTRSQSTTVLTEPGPICINANSQKPALRSSEGPITLSLGINTGNTNDLIVIRGLGLIVQ